jgi:hypothetical protein
MLALPFQTRGPVLVAGDDVDASRQYVSLMRPRVSRRPDGSSLVRLVRWVRSARPDEMAGARLSLDIEMRPTESEIAALGVEPGRIQAMPWADATILLDGPGFDPVEATVSSAQPGRGAVAVDLSVDAAAMLAPLLEGATVSPLQVTWRGRVPVRLPAVEVIATADISEITRRVTMIGRQRSRTVTRQIIDGHAHIEIRNAGSAALEQALRDWVLDELASRLAKNQPLSVRAAAADVVMWPLELATTLDDLIPSAHRSSIVETVVLDDSELGRTPPIEVRILGEFATLERVDVRLTAGSTVKELSFTSDVPQRAAMGAAPVAWSARVKRKGQPAGEWSVPTAPAPITSVIVTVASPRARRIDVFGAGLDFGARWAAVSVVLSVSGGHGGTDTRALDLTASTPSGQWIIPAWDPEARLSAKLTYLSRFGHSIEQVIDSVPDDHLVVRDPMEGAGLRVTLLPSGTGWDTVALAMVDVTFTDGAHVAAQTLELRRLTDSAEWIVPARADGPQTIQWRMHVSHQDGRFESRAWASAPAGVIVVRLDGVPKRSVQILPIYFDVAATRSATVRLRSGAQTETVIVSDRAARSLTLPAGPLTWTVQWTRADGSQLEESAATDGDDVIVLPRFAMR